MREKGVEKGRKEKASKGRKRERERERGRVDVLIFTNFLL